MSNTSAHHIKSICIVRLSALGDVLMMVPLIRTLQTYCPQVKLTWIISRPAYDLVEGISDVEFIVIKKPQNLLDFWHFYRQMSQRHFDILLAVQSSFRANLLYALIRARRKIGYDKRRAKDGHCYFIHETITAGHDHTLDGFLRFAQALGIKKPDIRWDLCIPHESLQWAREKIQPQDSKSRPIFLIHPAASKPERSWLIDRYIEIIRYVQTQWQAEVILIGGPGVYDQQLGESITQAVPVKNLIGQTKLKQLLAIISLADILLCPDTGVSHMASAVGTPVIALHAVTSSDVSGPYLYRHFCVDSYSTAITTVLHKTPETNVWGTHAHGKDTMALVSIAQVKQMIDHVFNYYHQLVK